MAQSDERYDDEYEVDAGTVVRAVLHDVAELTGKPPSGVTALERDAKDGWLVEVEVVEDRRIPSSSDILATYRAEVSPDGDLTSLRRTKRYPRGKGDEGA
ncbi:gas vesicle protein GvpO [Dactylosporangium sp. CA-139066]|uniref:gas vesicle protein GvpO n=1 Tax=Dactylosporangium sp. CA-139066 TaxID=3239930 RepID=UPI003D90D74D